MRHGPSVYTSRRRRSMTGWATLRTRHAAGRDAALGAAVRVTVEDEVGAGAVDRLGEQIAAEERVDLEPLALRASSAIGA